MSNLHFTVTLLQIDQAAIGLSREYLIKGLEDKIVKAYYEYMVDMAVIYGADRSRAERELMESLEFEMALANVMKKICSYCRLLFFVNCLTDLSS